MQSIRLYDILKSRHYINHELETNLQSARTNEAEIIHAALEKDHVNVYKVFYGILWENELAAAYEELLEGNITTYIEYIF